MFFIIGTILKTPQKTFTLKRSPYTAAALSAGLVSLSATLFFFNVYFRSFQASYLLAGIFISVLLASFIGFLLTAYLVKIACNILGGKGGFSDGLKVISFSSLMPSIGLFIVSLISSLSSLAGMPAVVVGSALSLLILPITMVIGFALVYKGMTDVFRLDAVKSLIAFSSIASALVFSFYIIVYLNIGSLITSLGFLGV